MCSSMIMTALLGIIGTTPPVTIVTLLQLISKSQAGLRPCSPEDAPSRALFTGMAQRREATVSAQSPPQGPR